MPRPLFTNDFMDTMYKNMWTFMNPDMIAEMFNIKITEKANVDDDNWTNEYKNSICFKGPEDEGHYVYVDKNKNAYGTYESNLLINEADDGICHGAAMIFAGLGRPHVDDLIPLPDIPDSEKKNFIMIYLKNYLTILEFYKWLIVSGKWDDALRKNFYYDVTWINGDKTTKETKASLKMLEKYILKLTTKLDEELKKMTSKSKK